MIGLAAILVGLGAALVVVGLLGRLDKKSDDLRELLSLPYGEMDVPVEAVTEAAGVWRFVQRAGGAFDRFDRRGSLARHLEAAEIPLRPGEYILVAAAGGVLLAAVFFFVTSSWWLLVLGLLVAAGIADVIPKRRADSRRQAFEAQLPDALSMIASSLSAGQTFLRAIQNMCEESEPPLAKEFARVVSESELGRPVVDALESAAERTGTRELLWIVQAIRIQQTVGGKLADLLHTLADFMRARQEVRREVRVLTAEGRISAAILSVLPLFLLVMMQVVNPRYLQPMLQGWHLGVLVVTGIWMLVGIAVLRRMVKVGY
jgi:tight adherence protein B